MGQPCPGTPTVTDADGNIYNTVQIGSQCWMKENLKTGILINGSLQMTDNNIVGRDELAEKPNAFSVRCIKD